MTTNTPKKYSFSLNPSNSQPSGCVHSCRLPIFIGGNNCAGCKSCKFCPRCGRFPILKTEEDVLKYWEFIDAFKQSIRNNKDGPKFVFYDGPPFATGLPHYGHIVASTLKDIFPRYKTQMGFQVERRWGFDTHGLPIEYEIEKELGIKTRQEVEDYGIGNYNEKCREIVMRYRKEWRYTISRLGRWVDFDNDYKTMDPKFMESVWWVFSQLFKKGMVYQSVKVMPYSTGCRTPLSNFEAKSNYKQVKDPSIIVKFKLVLPTKPTGLTFPNDRPTYLLVWTTTPWTLPSNLAICVNPELIYSLVLVEKTDKEGVTAAAAAAAYILSNSSVSKYFKKIPHKVVTSFSGHILQGFQYEGLFPFSPQAKGTKNSSIDRYPGCYRILTDSYVKEGNGTGLVHQAPTHGEDDFRVCTKAGIVSRDIQPPDLLDSQGCFLEEIKMSALIPTANFLSKLYFKDADEQIMANLKERGALFSKTWETHDYPYCWRSDTPLMYKTVSCWFIEVTPLQDKLLAMNEQVHWVPEFIGNGRFKEWLSHCQDWCVSRNRYWGTPIPIWTSEDGEEVVCIQSIQEFEQQAGLEPGTVTDLHCHHIDNYPLQSKRGKGPLKRTPFVFDCWFESGSMPYGQYHYPFENKELFENNFPCDFIAEGCDQTRGWFYTLLVLSTALFDRPAYKNVIVNGMVLAEDGEKMSKRKKNYPPPTNVLEQYGADALRLYLIDSRVVMADSLKFKEDDLRTIVKNVHIMTINMVQYWIETRTHYDTISSQVANREWQRVRVMTTDLDYDLDRDLDDGGSNDLKNHQLTEPLDSWILNCLDKFLTNLHQTMDKYDLSPILDSITKYIDLLSRWYIKLNKTRLRLEQDPSPARLDDVQVGLSVLFDCLYYFSVGLAPFAPFISEIVYQQLVPYISYPEARLKSVHFHKIPSRFNYTRNDRMVLSMEYLIPTMGCIRWLRSQRKVQSIKMPYSTIILIHPDKAILKALENIDYIIMDEGNVVELNYDTDWSNYVDFQLKPHLKRLGPKLGKHLKEFKKYLENMDELEKLDIIKHREGIVWYADYYEFEQIPQFQIDFDDLVIEASPKQKFKNWQTKCHEESDLVVMADPAITEDLLRKYYVRQFTRQVQDLRRKSGLQMSDQIVVVYSCNPENKYFTHDLFNEEIDIRLATEQLVGKLIPEGNFTDQSHLSLKQLGPKTALILDSIKTDIETPELVQVTLMM